MACALTGNISGEATDLLGNINREATRHESKYMSGLVTALMFGTNALGVLSYMHGATLRNSPRLEQQVRDAATKHPQCVPRRHF